MKRIVMTLLFLFSTGVCFAGDSVNIPWEEFKTLYAESIEKKLTAGRKPAPFIYSIESADYKIRIVPGGGIGQLILQGTSVSGSPLPIRLFNGDLIIKEITEVTGGSLLCEPKTGRGILFLPVAKEKFQITLSFYLPMHEDTRSGFVAMEIPKALKNTLHLTLSKELVLLEAPGIKDTTGTYTFSAGSTLSLRVAGKTPGNTETQGQDLSRHFKSVAAPPVVLDLVSYFVSFEQSGNVLSVLAMDVPKEAGPYLKINSIPNARIWSLKVNQRNTKLYTSGKNDSTWIIPLAKDATSHVEFAMIRQGEKIGLRGKLTAFLPGMELTARNIDVSIALPPRVLLSSFEGPLHSASKSRIKPPEEFMGRPYYFSRSFYKGQDMKIAVMYREPAK